MWYKRDISAYYRDKTSGIADVLCLQNENDRDLFQTCAACAVQTWDWSQFTFLLGHLHSYHASTNIYSVIEKYPKSSPTNLCAWQAPPPTRALPLSSSNAANHEHTAHVAGHWLSQNEKSNANWCKRTIQSSVTKKRSECRWAMHSARHELMSILAWCAWPYFRSKVFCAVVVQECAGLAMWLTLASLEHRSNPLWNLCSTLFDNQDFPHGFAGRNHYIEQETIFGQTHPNFSRCPVCKPFLHVTAPLTSICPTIRYAFHVSRCVTVLKKLV